MDTFFLLLIFIGSILLAFSLSHIARRALGVMLDLAITFVCMSAMTGMFLFHQLGWLKMGVGPMLFSAWFFFYLAGHWAGNIPTARPRRAALLTVLGICCCAVLTGAFL